MLHSLWCSFKGHAAHLDSPAAALTAANMPTALLTWAGGACVFSSDACLPSNNSQRLALSLLSMQRYAAAEIDSKCCCLALV